MRNANLFFWRSEFDRSENLSIQEIFLLITIVGSVFLDVLTNITQYLGAQGSAVALLKGLIIVAVIFSYRKIYSVLVTIGFFFIFCLREIYLTITESNIYLVDDSVFFLRIMFFICWILLFYEKRDRHKFLYYVLYTFVLMIVVSVFCQVAGMAGNIDFFKAYTDQRGGYKGLFYAENDTSVLYLPALIFGVFLWRTKKRLLALVALVGLILLGMGSKTALLGAVVVPLAYWFFATTFYSPIGLNLTIRPYTIFRWMVAFTVLGVIGFTMYQYFDQLFEALNYEQLLRVYSESGLLSSALSYRDVKVIGYFKSLSSFFHVAFGVQATEYTAVFTSDTPGPFMYEIDIFDYLARVGVVGLLLATVVMWRCAGLAKWRQQPPELKTMVFIIFVVGLTVGHTLISSLNGMWMGFWLIAFGQLPSIIGRRRQLAAVRPQG